MSAGLGPSLGNEPDVVPPESISRPRATIGEGAKPPPRRTPARRARAGRRRFLRRRSAAPSPHPGVTLGEVEGPVDVVAAHLEQHAQSRGGPAVLRDSAAAPGRVDCLGGRVVELDVAARQIRQHADTARDRGRLAEIPDRVEVVPLPVNEQPDARRGARPARRRRPRSGRPPTASINSPRRSAPPLASPPAAVDVVAGLVAHEREPEQPAADRRPVTSDGDSVSLPARSRITESVGAR